MERHDDDYASGRSVRVREAPTQQEPTETVPTLKDRPATTDALGRHVFAEVLAQLLVTNRADDPRGSFFLDLGGAWGSGKSTVLNFLRAELRARTPPWVVI